MKTKSGANQSQGLLLFHLTQLQSFAIGTLKVQEIVPYTKLTSIPNSHSSVLGAANFRGKTIAVIDMAKAIGYPAIAKEDRQDCVIIITDCSRQLVGFLVRSIDKIIECDWKKIAPPNKSLGKHTYVTGVTKVADKLVQLMDVELLLDQIYPHKDNEDLPSLSPKEQALLKAQNILVVDDSSVARRQLASALDEMGVHYFVNENGHDAFEQMKARADKGEPIDILVSDIEMPGLDGYELAFEVRSEPKIADSYIILHTSLSSEISVDRAHQIGADEALTKFDADELIHAILRGAEKNQARKQL
ncbi:MULTISPECIES: chemotaxis protein [unclassified Motilimonas]|uniref:chemotaxis protein n=1 Tax=Motilimonas TaxID=1914248 RepID=UPI001E61FC0C|nr:MULTISPECIES: chemotaxis protein [unclassified Motilimonas]MCE0557081.1 chemotaxis protein [Motilimonas sp. E26]MDO6524313.1 chemotaxis protein [Motilimonas sp. 1_MG-2023]